MSLQRIYSFKTIVVLSLFLASFLFSFNVSAQSQSGISISPPNTDLVIAPGEQVSKTFTIVNEGNASMMVKVYANGFSAAGDDGGVSFSPAGSGGLADWIELTPSSFLLSGGAAQNVTALISAPKGAAAGGQYATIFASSSDPNAALISGSGASVTTAVGANLLANVTGQVVERLSLAEFSTPRQRYNAGEDVTFDLRLTNSGNIHETPTGVVEIFRKGVKIDEVSVNPTNSRVLPNSSRKYSVNSSKILLPGAYTAKVTLQYGSGQTLSSPEITFAAIGDSSFLTLVVGGLAVLVVLLLLVILTGRKKILVK